MSETSFEYPANVVPINEATRQQLEDNLSELAENVQTPFPLVDLIKIGQVITAQQVENTTDPLTGVRNRRWFTEQLGATIAEAQRRGLTFYLILTDYDNFADVNKAYGHGGGDAALQLVANLSPREGEPISRFGGDEFVQIITPQKEIELVGLSERYHKEMQEKGELLFGKAKTLNGVERPPIGISIGIAKYQGESAEELIKKASEAAYQAKKAGRGTTILSRTINGQNRFLNLREYNQRQQFKQQAAAA